MNHQSSKNDPSSNKGGDTDDVAILTQKAKDLSEVGDIQHALETIVTAVKIRPDDPYLHYLQGNFLLSQKAYQEAIACYDKTLAIVPASPGVEVNRDYAILKLKEIAEAYYQNRDYANAVRCFEDLKKLIPQDTGVDIRFNFSQFNRVCNTNLYEMAPPSKDSNIKAYTGNMIVISLP